MGPLMSSNAQSGQDASCAGTPATRRPPASGLQYRSMSGSEPIAECGQLVRQASASCGHRGERSRYTPMSQLSWTDLFTDASHLDFKRLLGLWPKTVSGSVIPIGASAFGDLFFQRPLGNVEKLDVLVGGVHHAASSLEEFKSLMNSR